MCYQLSILNQLLFIAISFYFKMQHGNQVILLTGTGN